MKTKTSSKTTSSKAAFTKSIKRALQTPPFSIATVAFSKIFDNHVIIEFPNDCMDINVIKCRKFVEANFTGVTFDVRKRLV